MAFWPRTDTWTAPAKFEARSVGLGRRGSIGSQPVERLLVLGRRNVPAIEIQPFGVDRICGLAWLNQHGHHGQHRADGKRSPPAAEEESRLWGALRKPGVLLLGGCAVVGTIAGVAAWAQWGWPF